MMLHDVLMAVRMGEMEGGDTYRLYKNVWYTSLLGDVESAMLAVR
jgi:hypothetical protein